MCRGTSGLFLNYLRCFFVTVLCGGGGVVCTYTYIYAYIYLIYIYIHTHIYKIFICLPGHPGGEAERPEAVERVQHRDVGVRGGLEEEEQLFVFWS